MTKDNKYKEKAKIKILEDVSKDEMEFMYSSIIASKNGNPVSRQDFRNKRTLYNSITEEADEYEKGKYKFNPVKSLVLTISDHDKLIKDLEAPIFQNLEVGRTADILIERLENCETIKSDHTESNGEAISLKKEEEEENAEVKT